jgi:hypothetical protein
LFWVLIAAAGLLGSRLGFGQTEQSLEAPHKFLFVVETSRTMKPRVSGMAAAVKDLLDSKFRGQMRSGDLVGVWTYDQELRTNAVPFQELSPAVAVGVLNTILGGGYEKRGEPGVAWRSVARALVLTPRLTLILICSGEGELTGTTFDREINDAWTKWRVSQQRARQPVLTLLRARDGKLTDWSVTPGPWPLELPPLDRESVVVVARANLLPVTVTNAPPAAKPTNAPSGVAEQPGPAPATNAMASLAAVTPVAPPALNTQGKTPASEATAVAVTNEIAKTTPGPSTAAGAPEIGLNVGGEKFAAVAKPAMTENSPAAEPASGSSEGSQPRPRTIAEAKQPIITPVEDWSAVKPPDPAMATQSVILPAKAPRTSTPPGPRRSAPETAEAVGGSASTQDASGSEVTGGEEPRQVTPAKPLRPDPQRRSSVLMVLVGLLGLAVVFCFGMWFRSFRR